MNPAALKAAVTAWQQAKALHAAGRLAEAEPLYRKALATLPKTPDLLADYARLAEKLGDWNAAEKIWARFDTSAPTRSRADRRGLALAKLGRFAEGVEVLEAYHKRYPDDADSLLNLAVCYNRMMRDEDAMAALRHAIAVKPQLQQAWESLVVMLVNDCRREEADVLLKEAIHRFPDNRELRFALMEHKLKSLDFAGGFDMFEARWGTDYVGTPVVLPTERLWDGSPFEGRLIIRAEQGIGDELLYSGLFADLLARHPDTVIECEPRLLALFGRSFPQATFVARDAPLDDPLRATFDRQCIAGDLNRWLRRSPSDCPTRSGWLRPDPDLRDTLRADYRQRYGNALRVGLSWRSRHPANGVAKSLTLEMLRPLLGLPGIRFFSLQYGDVGEELDAFAHQHGIEIDRDPRIDPTRDIDGLAARIDAMDLVVSTSNTTVHLAGALGVPTWVMLQRDHGLCWYWAYEGEQVPWYPSVRLFRCPSRKDWTPVISDIGQRLVARARHGA